MKITEASIKILKIIYNKTVGNANVDSLIAYLHTHEVISEVQLLNINEFIKCLSYLKDRNYITIKSRDDDNEIGVWHVKIEPRGIEYIESN